MKKIIILLFCFIAFIIGSCAKEPIPDDKAKFIGQWRQIEKGDATYEIDINEDATGKYGSYESGKTVEFAGYVKFQGSTQFTIGGKLIKKKISVDKAPQKIVESLQPYVFRYEATFNGVKFKKQ